ncbi:hypothetical protein C0J52_23400 [Blattella germanica]|nr:hypothetical protein C0J52_23400 [Blattella germanica]
MGARYWKPAGPLLLMLPNVTALLLLAGAFLLLNGPPAAIRTSAIKINRGGLLPERLDKTRNCSRPCLDGIKPKECYFKLVLEPSITLNSNCSKCGNNKEERPCVYADGVERMTLAVNRRLPGTPMQMCEGDVVVVDVENYLPGLETSLHWHGQVQRGTPYMDGVPMITQCPIQSGTRFRYKFRASNPGTHFYHSHFVSHHADGIFGPFIVRQSRSRDPHYKMYDHDLDEHVITIAPWTHSLLAYNLDFQENLQISSLLINGRGNFLDQDKRMKTEVPNARFAVKWGKRYRFRLINAASLDCERYDVILEANQEISSYWMKVKGHHKCENIHQDAVLIYDGAVITNLTNDDKLTTTNEHIDTDLKLRSFGKKSYPELQSVKADKTLFVPFDVFSFDNLDDKDINFNFTLDDLPYYPSYLYNRKRPVKLPQINGVTFSYPSSPLLSQPEDVPRSAYCEERCKLTAGF